MFSRRLIGERTDLYDRVRGEWGRRPTAVPAHFEQVLLSCSIRRLRPETRLPNSGRSRVWTGVQRGWKPAGRSG
eukprot:7435187-Pyramimonas_sp.AAC.1